MTYASRTFSALADPTRREIFERLSKGPRSVGDLARGLPVSRPAVSQHLRTLKSAGLAMDRAQGTRRANQIDPARLAEVPRWPHHVWDRALTAFQAEFEEKQEQT